MTHIKDLFKNKSSEKKTHIDGYANGLKSATAVVLNASCDD